MATAPTGIEDRWSLFTEAPDLVAARYLEAKTYAQEAYNNTIDTLATLVGMARELAEIGNAVSIDEVDLASISLPERDEPEEPDFSANYPSIPSEPSNLIDVAFGELPSFPDPLVTSEIGAGDQNYTSSVLTALQAALLNTLQNGGTGLDEDVEDAIFEREQERALLVHNDTMDRISAEWSKRGFPLPNGALLAAFQEEEINYTNKRLDVSRDISIKQAELAQQNTHFAIQQAVQMEAMLINWANNVAERIWQVSKAVVDAQLARYKVLMDGAVAQTTAVIEEAKGKIEYNKGLIEQYRARVEAYRSAITGEAARIEATAKQYGARVDSFKALAEYDVSRVGLDIKILEARIQQAIANSNIMIKDAEIRLKNYEALNALKIEAAKTAAQIMSHIATGALSSIHVAANIGASATSQYQVNNNYSFTTA